MKNRVLFWRVFLYLLLIVVAVIFIAPILLMTVSAFKPTNQIMLDMSGLRAFLPVGELSLDNLDYLFNKLDVGRFFINSLVVTTIAVVVTLLFDSMMGFALGMLRFKGQRVLLTLVLALMVVPSESIIINRMVIANEFNLIDTLAGLILPFLSTPLYIFLFYQHFRGMPRELMEAAEIDGCSLFRTYWKIMMPLSKPVISTVAILTFVKRWGEVAWPSVIVRSRENNVLPLALQSFYSDLGNDWGPLFSLAALMTIPILIVFFIFQKQFISSMAHAGVKG